MTLSIRFAGLTLALLSAAQIKAQSARVDAYSSEQLANQAQHLRDMPKFSTGNSGETLQRYPYHYTMLIVRNKDGEAELHQNLADVFIVTAGKATLWTGGSMQNSRNTDPGEQRGSGLIRATSISLKTGDIVHIPANVPHQLRISPGASFTYFVVKVSQTASQPQPAH
jgi:mannose-6-phosphate isomerase-like protein (cupin superfamily)